MLQHWDIPSHTLAFCVLGTGHCSLCTILFADLGSLRISCLVHVTERHILVPLLVLDIQRIQRSDSNSNGIAMAITVVPVPNCPLNCPRSHRK